MRVVLRCASMDHGAQWVVVDGVLWMLKWCADNWALAQLVGNIMIIDNAYAHMCMYAKNKINVD